MNLATHRLEASTGERNRVDTKETVFWAYGLDPIVGFKVLTAMAMKTVVFRVITPCSS
jgi:hypothetical protein